MLHDVVGNLERSNRVEEVINLKDSDTPFSKYHFDRYIKGSGDEKRLFERVLQIDPFVMTNEKYIVFFTDNPELTLDFLCEFEKLAKNKESLKEPFLKAYE